jgi:chemosensory pili system protein ChpA (sensor histidine kinase/response regulator)
VSTRDQADQLAGRGVGLDTVRETIARLGGEIRTISTPGKGTRFTMRLPVSTAVSHALLFKVYRDVYALPYVHVVETVQVERVEVDGRDEVPAYLMLRGDRTPLVCLQDVLESQSPVEMPVMPAIVMEYAGLRLAITCDKVVGPREIVVKELGPLLAPLPLYAGATISGSGKVQLILDPAALARLAYPDSQPAAAPARPPPVSPDDTQSLTFSRALVVDDSPAIREAMLRILTSSGYVVDCADSGASAWSLVSRVHYDLVVTDLEMPELDGFGLIERIRGDARLTHMPVIIVSSRDEPGHRERARQLAVKSFVQKPVTPRKLQDALKAL